MSDPIFTFLTIQHISQTTARRQTLLVLMETITIPVADASFESLTINATSNIQVAPLNTAWTWSAVDKTSDSAAGITAFGSRYTPDNIQPPDGVQTAFLQGVGWFSQVLNFPENGTYWLNFSAAQRSSSRQKIAVLLDGRNLGSWMPNNETYEDISTGNFSTTSGLHTISFRGLNPLGGANVVMIDQIVVQGVPDSANATNATTPTTLINSSTVPTTAQSTSPFDTSSPTPFISSQSTPCSPIALILAFSIPLLCFLFLLFLYLYIRRRNRRNSPKHNPYRFQSRQASLQASDSTSYMLPYWREESQFDAAISNRASIATMTSLLIATREFERARQTEGMLSSILQEPEPAVMRPDSPTLPEAERFSFTSFILPNSSAGTESLPETPSIVITFANRSDEENFREVDLWPDIRDSVQLNPNFDS
ncbi:hypothetical protein BC936DRAFT_149474 [Jimgerdemannia flammicorona]|uniref:Uncharacterized protein n=1 Tax=Jimgerdemannia flammicorona TaxID=994334 RepID=A0A433D0R0_9FUNG|nr:hypothetical protein BC936DRAFT_149474 [Jimgerdemannia flammicorona]